MKNMEVDMKGYVTKQMKDILTLANNYAEQNTTCKKTAVGCYIVNEDPKWRTIIAKGCNNSDRSCKHRGCLREQLFGSNSKEHRTMCRCYGNHAEQDALKNVPAEKMHLLQGATAFVTRYPCADCARALVDAGIKRIVYGREFPMEEDAELACVGVEVIHIADWNCDKNDTNN